ncbi:MAG: lytic transglycosylase domain-containing protein [Candidatus Acidiferrales bacterium]
MRLTRILLSCAFIFAAAPALRAEYVALRSGQRLHVTGYQLLGEKYRLQVAGGIVEVPAEDVLSIDPEDDFAALSAPVVATAPFREIVNAAAARYSVDADLISSVIAAESNFDPKAISKRNARGLMQLLPQTATRFGVQNIFDPQENIEAGTHYLRDLLQRYNNNLALALAAYNAGPERVQQFGRVPPYAETVSYVRRVKRTYEKSKSGAAPLAPAKLSEEKKAAASVEHARAGAFRSRTYDPN